MHKNNSGAAESRLVKSLTAWATFLFLLTPCQAQIVSIQPGSSMNIDGSTLSVGCGDLLVGGLMAVGSGSAIAIRDVVITGQQSMGSGLVSLSGSWSNNGGFSPGTGTVDIGDGCDVSVSELNGNTNFYNFSATTSTGKVLQVAAGTTQTFANSLTLKGTVSQPLSIRSSAPGNPAFFSLTEGGSQSISGVDVADNNASGGQHLAPVTPDAVNSIDSGGNTNWFIAVAQIVEQIDTLPKPALALLALLMALLTLRYRQNSTIEKLFP